MSAGAEHHDRAPDAKLRATIELDARREHPDWKPKRIRRAAIRRMRDEKRGIGGKGRA